MKIRRLAASLVRFATELTELFFSRRISRSAAALAYFLVLTFFPVLICLSAFVGSLELDLGALLAETELLLPGGVVRVLEEYLGYLEGSRTAALLAVGVLTAVFFASAAVRVLMNVMGEIYGCGTLRGFRQIAASVFFAILLLMTVYISLVVVVTGGWFFRMAGEFFRVGDLAEQTGLWQWVKYPALLGVVFLFILLLYRFTAPVGRRPPPVFAGALASAMTLVLASAVFAWFVGRSARYSLVYGSLASVIILLVWLYLCGNILILGSGVNYLIWKRKASE